MKTALEDSPTKQSLMGAAQKLMLEKGYVATSIDEICEAAGVTKGSFFHYFKNKEHLAKELAKRFGQYTAKSFKSGKDCDSADPLERVYAAIDCGIEMSKNPNVKGCLIGTFSQELSESHPEIREVCCDIFSGFIDTFKKDLAEAKKKYAPKSSINPEVLAESYLAMAQGSMILMKAKKDRSVMERTLTEFRSYLKFLFGK